LCSSSRSTSPSSSVLTVPFFLSRLCVRAGFHRLLSGRLLYHRPHNGHCRVPPHHIAHLGSLPRPVHFLPCHCFIRPRDRPTPSSDKIRRGPYPVLSLISSFCRKCRFHVARGSFHCVYCDVCIEGYDHHCPWTSKCIGKNNLIRFYLFVFLTPILMVYCTFAFVFTMDHGGQQVGGGKPVNLRVVGK
jgi:hypothetical protein